MFQTKCCCPPDFSLIGCSPVRTLQLFFLERHNFPLFSSFFFTLSTFFILFSFLLIGSVASAALVPNLCKLFVLPLVPCQICSPYSGIFSLADFFLILASGHVATFHFDRRQLQRPLSLIVLLYERILQYLPRLFAMALYSFERLPQSFLRNAEYASRE